MKNNIFELMFNTTLLDCFIHSFWIGKDNEVAKIDKCELGQVYSGYSEVCILRLFSESKYHYSQPAFEEVWLKILTCCTYWIITAKSLQFTRQLGRFEVFSRNQRKKEKKKSGFILCCLSVRNETVKNLDNIYTCCL